MAQQFLSCYSYFSSTGSNQGFGDLLECTIKTELDKISEFVGLKFTREDINFNMFYILIILK